MLNELNKNSLDTYIVENNTKLYLNANLDGLVCNLNPLLRMYANPGKNVEPTNE